MFSLVGVFLGMKLIGYSRLVHTGGAFSLVGASAEFGTLGGMLIGSSRYIHTGWCI